MSVTYVAVGVNIRDPKNVEFKTSAGEAEGVAREQAESWLREGVCHAAVVETVDQSFTTVPDEIDGLMRQAIVQATPRLEKLVNEAIREGRLPPPPAKGQPLKPMPPPRRGRPH